MLPSGRIGVTGITTTVASASFSRAVVASSSAIDPPEGGEAAVPTATLEGRPGRVGARGTWPRAPIPLTAGSASQVPAARPRGRRAPVDDVLVDLVVGAERVDVV